MLIAIRPCLAIFFALLMSCATTHGADAAPTDLSGQIFAISFPTEKGKPQDKLTFATDGVTCKALGAAKVPVKFSTKKKSKSIEFAGKITDDKGTVIEVSGSATGTDIHGSITRTEKDNDPKAMNFSGSRSGQTAKK